MASKPCTSLVFALKSLRLMFFPKNILAKIGFNLHHPSRNLLRKTSIYTTPSFHTAGAYSLLVNLPPGLASWHREVVGRLAAIIGDTFPSICYRLLSMTMKIDHWPSYTMVTWKIANSFLVPEGFIFICLSLVECQVGLAADCHWFWALTENREPQILEKSDINWMVIDWHLLILASFSHKPRFDT